MWGRGRGVAGSYPSHLFKQEGGMTFPSVPLTLRDSLQALKASELSESKKAVGIPNPHPGPHPVPI